MDCPNCGTTNRTGVRFCNNCGKSLTTLTPGGNANGTSRSLAPGARLQGGRYDIKKVLGQGGMGAALLAVDNRLDGKRVVIKELLSENTDPARLQDDVRNFKREVSLLAHIDHPLVPNVTDHFQEGSRYFMVQEYAEGENLEDYIDRTNQPMRERDALLYASQLLDILDYLEQQTPPIVHRDIKPANIIIGARDKRVHLVDFGIARADVIRNAVKKQTSALGTPGYAPPEQYQGNADPRSDLYALAATLHHLLTNRDPRNHPPFVYPPVRTLNPQLSPEIEQVLTRALTNDVNQRYQSAAAFKREVDEILLKRFGVSGDIGNYMLGTSGPMGAIAAQNQPTVLNTPGALPPPPPAWQPASGPGPGGYSNPYAGGAPPPPRSGSHTLRNVILVLLVLVVVIGTLYFGIAALRKNTTTAASGTATPALTVTPPSTLRNGLGAYQVTDKQSGYKEFIGLSDGSVAFDRSRPDGPVKQQAADKLAAGDIGGAESLWQSALSSDVNDAEALIYLEDQRVLATGSPYITLVVATMLTSNDSGVVGTGRDDLQGAYMAQRDYNTSFKLGNGVLVRLLIANSGSASTYAGTIATQIVQAAQADKTIVGVMGWPYSSRTVNAVSILARAHLPLVSQTASSDLLTGVSPYFYRVCPSNQEEGISGADYASRTLHAQHVALFSDTTDAYSKSLGEDFKARFQANGGQIVATEQYTVGKPQTLPAQLQDALSHGPDLIYFSGYASDLATLLTNLPTSGPYAQIQIMGGDALYELGGYPPTAHAGFSRVHFTAFAYPDEWGYLKQAQPVFFSTYVQTFSHAGQPSGYGYTRPDNDVILSYDATLTLLEGSRIVLTGGKTTLTGVDLQRGLGQITGAQALQGISGVISLAPDGNPVGKAEVVLLVDNQGRIRIENVQGHFLK